MATSGTVTYNETAGQIITDALCLLAVVNAGETPNTNDMTLGMTFLNKMVKAWMGQGIHLWTEESGTIYLVNGQAQYNLYAGGPTYASDGTGTPVETTVAVGSSGGNSVTVTSSTGMSINDNIGIQQNNNVIMWTTISNIVGNTITMNASTTYATNIGNGVFTYTNQMPRALSIQSARLRNNSGFDKMMEIKPREDYMRIPEKQLTGDPIILYYSPQLTQGQVYIWPAPYDVSKRIEVTWLREIQDFNSTSNNPDFPQEWLEALTFNLACRLAPAFGISLSSGGISGNPDLLVQAAQYLDAMKAWDAEQPYVSIIRKPYY